MKSYQHQIEDTNTLIARPYFALLNEMGTGKSKTIVDACLSLYESKEIDTVIIICPKTVISSWVKNHLKEQENVNSHHYKPLYKYITTISFHTLTWIIINYEQLRNNESLKYISLVLEKKDCVLILDESQKIANYKAKITKSVLKISHLAKRKYILSGTPIRKNPLDYYTQFKFLHENILPFKTFFGFRNRYAQMGGFKVNGVPVQVVGFRDLDNLRSLVDKHMIHRTKEECLDLPEQVYVEYEIELSIAQAKVYLDMEEHAIAIINDATVAAPVKITQILKLREITAGFLKEKEEYYAFDNNKIKVITDVMESKEHIVIFCIFHKEIDEIARHLSSKKMAKDYGIIAGNITGKLREQNIEAFQNKELDAMIVQVEAGGVGIDLFAADTAIYLSNAYNWDSRDQSESRIHRIGQTRKCTYIDVLATIDGKPTIDHDIRTIIAKKKSFADYMLKDKIWKTR